MKFQMKIFILALLLLFVGVSCVSANETNNDVNVTDIYSINENEDVNLDNSQVSIEESQVDDVIEVDSWDELQYYCSLKDKDYTLKLKDNTNFYPTKPGNSNYQIKVYNNVKIIGGDESYIGDNSLNPRTIVYAAIVVPDGYKSSIYMENVTFKQISCGYVPDGVFFKIGGSQNSVLKNCHFENIEVHQGHACIVHLSRGTATLENCSFINCQNGYGCVSVYDPNSVKTVEMIVRDCYFENNYASTEPGCINNCGKLTVYNSTFVKNRSFWWAGAIHTHNHGNTTIYDSNFTDNLAGWNGGALYTYSYLQIYNTVFEGNNCTTNNGGGAIGACAYQSNPHIYIENSLFKNNQNLCWSLTDLSTSGTGRGGAISLMDEGSIEVRNTTFIANSASIGTAICALAMGGYGSPDIIIVNNSFINHTRVGDTLNIRVDGTGADISDNYYYGNSIVFSKLTLAPISVDDNQAILQVNASLSNPSFYDEDILDRTLYDVYVNGEYYKTLNSSRFVFDFGDWDICDVYVVPTISNCKSNEITLISTREYIFVSKSNGSDLNNGISRDSPVKSIQKALELAESCNNILILDGEYEGEFQIDYDVTIKGENNVSLTNNTSFIVNCNNFGINNLNIHDLSSDIFIKQVSGNLTVDRCIFEDNNKDRIIGADNISVSRSIFKNNGAICIYNNNQVSMKNSILLNNSHLIGGNLDDVNLNYNWWGNTLNNISKPDDFKLNNWLVLNSTVSEDILENGQTSSVHFDFYLVEDNQLSKYDNLVKVNFDISCVNGSSSLNITNFNSNIIYTQTGFGDGILTIRYEGITMDTKFKFIKSSTKLSIQTVDISATQDLTIKVSSSKAVDGNLTVYVGNVSKTQRLDSNVVTFVFKGIKAGQHTIIANYSGDRKYLSQQAYSKVSVSKSSSSTKISAKVKTDATITVTVPGATGIITFSVNGVSQNVTLSNSKYIYTLKNVARGDYHFKVVYYGDDKYLPSEASYLLEVDNVNPTVNISIPDSVYGGAAVVEVHVDDNATGNVSVTVDGITNSSEVINSTAFVHLYGLNAGLNKKATIFYTGDDTYYSKTLTKYMNINKANFTFNMTSTDIRIGQDAVIYITVPPRTSGNFTIGDILYDIPMSGEVFYVLQDLPIGEYEFTAVYEGDNYNTVSNSTSFRVIEFPIPQWENEGKDTYNTHKADYVSHTNGAVLWTSQVNSTIIGNLAIDSEGNIYITTSEGIYSYDFNGELRWIYETPSRDGNFSGIAISRDVVISPRACDTIYFINQSTGEKYGYSNIYQASSLFAPIVDSNAVIYTVSEYQIETRSYNLAITPYKLWENGGDPKLISLGSTKPIAAPSVNDDMYVVLGEKRLMVVDANTLETVFIKSGNFKDVRPVIGEGNIIYAVLDDSIVAYSNTGSQFWRSTVTGGSPVQLAADSELGLYAVNAKGNLYRYDLVDGTEELISDLEITSGLLIDTNGNLYFAASETFYGISSSGEVLWKSELGSMITSTPVMDESGIIYVTGADNRVFALGKFVLSDCNMSVEVHDVSVGESLLFEIDLPSDASGIITLNFNGKNYTVSENRIAFDNLPAKVYDYTVSYGGDSRYAPKILNGNVSVLKINTQLTADVDDITVGEDAIVNIKMSGNVSGTVTTSINGKNYTGIVSNGVSKIIIPDLKADNYTISVYFTGDRYADCSNTTTFTVSKVKLTEDALSVDGIVFALVLPNDATGKLTVNVNNKDYTQNVIEGQAILSISDLAPGNYTAHSRYSGDEKYESIRFKDAIVSIEKLPSGISVKVDNVNVGDEAVVNITTSVIAGKVMVTVDDKDYNVTVEDYSGQLSIPNLAEGNYIAIARYLGDDTYSYSINTTGFSVLKVEILIDNETITLPQSDTTVYSVNLPSDATGTLTVTVDGLNYTSQLVDGKATVNIPELSEGAHTITVAYSGDSKYESIIKSGVVEVNKTVEDNSTNTTTEKIDPTLVVSADDINVGDNAIINVKASFEIGNVTINVNGKDYPLIISNGDASVSISGLAAGNYNLSVSFMGDEKYNEATNSSCFNVLKVNVPVTNETITLPDGNSTEYSVNLPSDATGTLTVTVDGLNYTSQLVDGKATVIIPELGEGAHTITVAYSGDSKYETIVKSGIVNVNKTSDNITNATGDNSTNTTVKADSTLAVNVEDVNVGDNAIVNVKASFESGNITVNVNGKDHLLVIRNGEASVSISDLAAGNYTVLAIFTGDDKLNPASNATSFNVLKVEVPVGDETISIPSGDSTSYSISLPGDATGTLTVTVDGENYAETLVNGKATVNIPELTTGSHNITVTYSGDAKYSPITKSSVVTKAPLIELTGSNLNMLYTSGKYFKVRLTADGVPLEGQTVKITINGKTYSKITNKDCYASLKISLPPKTYSVKASYANTTITKKVVVKSLIKAKNVNAKKSAKTVKIKVTLKKVNGKYLKNKKVTLKFNKKTLKAKTNKRGVVTFTIKKNVYSKLKTNKKYTYQVIYAKDKIKKTIKFKK